MPSGAGLSRPRGSGRRWRCLTCRLGFAAYGQDFSRTYLEKIDLGYGGAGEKDIGLIEQSDLRRAGSPKHRGIQDYSGPLGAAPGHIHKTTLLRGVAHLGDDEASSALPRGNRL
jgi:hypothetical protein